MTGPHAKVYSSIWSDDEFIALSPECQQLYFLLLSSGTRSHAGVLAMTLRRWSNCSGGSTMETVRANLMQLAQTRFVVIDWDTEEVLVRTYIRNDGVYRQPNVMKSAIKSALSVTSRVIREALAGEIRRLPGFEDRDDWIAAAFALAGEDSEPLAKGSVKGSGKGSRGVNANCGEGEGEGVSSKQNLPTKKEPLDLLTNSSNAREVATVGKSKIVVELGNDSVHVSNETRELVHASVAATVLRSRRVRDALMGHAQMLLDDGADPHILQASLREWQRRSGSYPGDLPHIYTEGERRMAGPVVPRNGQPLREQSKSERWDDVLREME